MNNFRKFKKYIFRDCRKMMMVTLLMTIVVEIFTALTLTFSSDQVGKFMDAVFNLDTNTAFANIKMVLILQAVNIFLVPFINLMSNIFMLKNALAHDRLLYNNFLHKNYINVSKMAEETIDNRLEGDAIEFRYYWIFVRAYEFVFPIIFLVLFYMTAKINLIYGVIVLLISIIKTVVPFLTKDKGIKYDKLNREYKGEYKEVEMDFMTNPCYINTFGISDKMISKIDMFFRSFYVSTLKKSIHFKKAIENFSSLTNDIIIVVILLIGSYLTYKNIITVGEIVAMLQYLVLYDFVFEKLIFIIKHYKQLATIGERLVIFYEDIDEVKKDFKENTSEKFNLQVSDLSFSYDDHQLFKNINFTVNENDKVMIYGKNGSGKTTLNRILAGLIKKYEGNVTINDMDIKDIPFVTLKKYVAYVMQEPYIFDGTVYENVRLGNEQATDEQIVSIMKQLNIYDLKDRKIRAMSNELSGGEKQRISIARAILRNSKLIVLDEPSNSLDKEGIEWLKNFIKNYNKTILFVTHDNNLVECANKKISLT